MFPIFLFLETSPPQPFAAIHDANNIEKLAARKRKRFLFAKHASVGKQGKAFIRKLLSADPAQRPDASQVKEHPWLSKINWASMETKQYYVRLLYLFELAWADTRN